MDRIFVSSIMFIVSFNLSGCANSPCETRVDAWDRYQCLNNRLLPEVAKGATVGAAVGGLVGLAIQAGMHGGRRLPLIGAGVIVGAGTGGAIAYYNYKETLEEAARKVQEDKFDRIASNRKLDILGRVGEEAISDSIRKFQENKITKEELVSRVKQVSEDGVKQGYFICDRDKLCENKAENIAYQANNTYINIINGNVGQFNVTQ